MSENPYNPPTTQPNNEASRKGLIESFLLSFLRHWNGEAKLVTAFWGHFILGNFLFSLVLVLVSVVSSESNIAAILQVVLSILNFIYYICTVRFIWSCAGNSNYSGFFYIVRGLVVLLCVFAIFVITGYEAITDA